MRTVATECDKRSHGCCYQRQSKPAVDGVLPGVAVQEFNDGNARAPNAMETVDRKNRR